MLDCTVVIIFMWFCIVMWDMPFKIKIKNWTDVDNFILNLEIYVVIKKKKNAKLI